MGGRLTRLVGLLGSSRTSDINCKMNLAVMHNQRFFAYLSLFTFMMIILVTANNFLLMFVGWEGVGICSYLLVNFWYTRIAANQSSISALLTNRVGDCFLTIGMFAILWSFGKNPKC